jgi:ribosomal protein S18 acetylase RimI-like enzyme
VNSTEDLLDAQAAHFRATDALLPAPVPPPGGAPVGAVDADGRPVLALLHEVVHDPDSLPSLWSALHTQQLYPLVGSGAAIDPLLRRWHDLVADRPDQGVDSSCLVTWPSRDVAATRDLLRHGLAPLTVLAVRTTSAGRPPPREVDVRVRAAEPADLPAMLRLAMAELEYSAHLGATVLRPNALELKENSLRQWFISGAPALLAELDGAVLGMAQYRWSRIDESSTPRLLPNGMWGYLNCLSVLPAARGRGIGQRLMTEVHAHLDRQGVPGAYLYYNPPNPLSSVFWPRHGYRPLWTLWEARPARALR